MLFTKYDPATGQCLWSGEAADAAEVDRVVCAARRSFELWRDTSLASREHVVRRFAELVRGEQDRLALMVAQETGKPLWDAAGEIAALIAKVEVSIRSQQQRASDVFQTQGDTTAVVRHRPHGVVAVFGPYNFPLHLPHSHIIPALLAGNAVVFKPSECAPLSAQSILLLWQQAGLPEGVLHVVQGERATGVALANHPGIDGLFFTGSSATGKALHRAFAGQPAKILALEMGGNNPLVVDEVADMDAAVVLVVQSAFLSCGQRCTCARRVFVPATDWGDRFVTRLVEVARTFTVGPWHQQPEPFIGAVVSLAAAQALLAGQQQLQSLGGQSLLTMRQLVPDRAMLTPAIIDMTHAAQAPDVEWFGPLLQLYRYPTFESALVAANATSYGLSAGLVSEHPARYEAFWRTMRAGIIKWNRPLTGALGTQPFGGVGDSGNHRASAWYAADYCAYPVAAQESSALAMPAVLPPGLVL
jgi:succinylglutamic semialdehyde dehydrogenase